MILRSTRNSRPGATIVESAVVYPLTFFLILSLIIGAMGIFRYQEMAALAREASRYASTHGASYRKDAGLPTGTAGTAAGTAPADVGTTVLWYQTHPTQASGTYSTQWADITYDNTIRNQLFMLDPASLQVWVGWPPVVNQPTLPDNYPGSRVVVCVKYPVFPEPFIWWNPDLNNVTVSSSLMPITN